MGPEVNPQDALQFRQPMEVQKLAQYRSGGTFPICPQCGCAIEREYQHYCDRCGQRLDWRKLRHAVIVTRG